MYVWLDLDHVLQEKESAMEMWQASVQEVERLEQQLQVGQYRGPPIVLIKAVLILKQYKYMYWHELVSQKKSEVF